MYHQNVNPSLYVCGGKIRKKSDTQIFNPYIGNTIDIKSPKS